MNNKINGFDAAARDRSSHLQAVVKSLQQWCREQYAHQSSMLVQCEEQLDSTKKVLTGYYLKYILPPYVRTLFAYGVSNTAFIVCYGLYRPY